MSSLLLFERKKCKTLCAFSPSCQTRSKVFKPCRDAGFPIIEGHLGHSLLKFDPSVPQRLESLMVPGYRLDSAGCTDRVDDDSNTSICRTQLRQTLISN